MNSGMFTEFDSVTEVHPYAIEPLIKGFKEASPIERQAKIERIQAAMEQMDGALGEDPFPLGHSWAPGLYAREVVAPEGILIVTKLHKTSHFIFLLEGDVTIFDAYGVRRIQGPTMLMSQAGVKRIVYTHSKTVWVNVHANPENMTDLDELENKLIAKNYTELGLPEPVVAGELEA